MGDGKVIEVKELLGKTKVEFCKHAIEQMGIRNITEKEVVATIRNPDKIGLPTQSGRFRVRKFKRPRFATDVVYIIEPDRVVVVTAFPKKFAKS